MMLKRYGVDEDVTFAMDNMEVRTVEPQLDAA